MYEEETQELCSQEYDGVRVPLLPKKSGERLIEPLSNTYINWASQSLLVHPYIRNILQRATSSVTTREETQESYQDTRTDEGDDNTPNQSTCTDTKQAEQPATNEGTDQADDDISNDTIATATHYHAGQEACNQTNN